MERVSFITASYPEDPRAERLHFNRRLASGRFGNPPTDQVVKLEGAPGTIADRHRNRLRRYRSVEHHHDAVVAQSAQEHVNGITRENLGEVAPSQRGLALAEGDECLHVL